MAMGIRVWAIGLLVSVRRYAPLPHRIRETTRALRLVSAPAAAVREGARFAYVKAPEGNLIKLIQSAA